MESGGTGLRNGADPGAERLVAAVLRRNDVSVGCGRGLDRAATIPAVAARPDPGPHALPHMKTLRSKLPLLLLCLVVGCKSAEEKRAEREAKQAEREAAMKEQMHANCAADSPLQKVTLGMSESDVQAILGPPTTTSSHMTGKAFNPWNFSGRDTVRVVYHWAGVGRVEFSQGSWGQRNGAVLCYSETTPTGSGQ